MPNLELAQPVRLVIMAVYALVVLGAMLHLIIRTRRWHCCMDVLPITRYAGLIGGSTVLLVVLTS